MQISPARRKGVVAPIAVVSLVNFHPLDDGLLIMTILSAEVTTVKLGQQLAIEGLMTKDGTFYVGVPQLTAINLVQPNRALNKL